MNKKELVEELKRKMPVFSGTDEEKEIKTALYIYIELGRMKEFDESYYFGNSKDIRRVMSDAVRNSENPDKISKKRKIICVTMAHLYKSILEDFGIQSRVVTKLFENGQIEHMSNIIDLKSGKSISADAQLDMFRVQTGMCLKNFGSESEYNTDVIKTEQLIQMLIDVGYIKDKDDFRDGKIEEVKGKIDGLNCNEAVSAILNSPEIYGENRNQGVVEAHKYYFSILKMLLPDDFGRDVFLFQCSKQREEKEQDFSFGIYANVDNVEDLQVYLYSKNKGRLLACDLENLISLQNQGLKIGKNDVQRPVKILKSKMKKFERKQIGDEPR